MNTNHTNHTNQATELLEMWTALDNAIKKVETASTANLSTRIAELMEHRAKMDDHVMELASAIFKNTP